MGTGRSSFDRDGRDWQDGEAREASTLAASDAAAQSEQEDRDSGVTLESEDPRGRERSTPSKVDLFSCGPIGASFDETRDS
jgi:hypothetical protein